MDPSFGTLRCTLLDRRSSAPLRGAQIMCVGREGQVAVFDADDEGRFATGLPEGVYDLVVSARGYLALTLRGVGVLVGHEHALTRGLVPAAGGRSAAAEPATAIAGYVVDRIGLPVADVAVHVNEAAGRSAYTTRTDRLGAYVLSGVTPGMYDLAVRADDRTVAFTHVPIAHVKDLVRVDLRVLQL